MEPLFLRSLKLFLLLLVALAFVFFLYKISSLVQVLLVSAILAYVLDPLVTFIEARGVNRTLATVLLFSGILLLLGGFALLYAPAISREVAGMRDGFDAEKVRQFLQRVEVYLQSRLGFLGLKDLNLAETLSNAVIELGNMAFSNLLNLVGVLTNLILLPFVTFFLIKDGLQIKKWLVHAIPNRYFEFSLNLLYKMDLQLGNYLRGQVLDGMVIGVLSIAALWILDVKYAVVIGSFAGMFNLIPYVGPLAGALLAITVSLVDTGDPNLVLQIAGAFAVVQLLDNVLVQPAIVARNVDLPPLVVLLVVLIGGKFFGILGMLLSVPFTAIVKVFVQEGLPMYRKFRFTSRQVSSYP